MRARMPSRCGSLIPSACAVVPQRIVKACVCTLRDVHQSVKHVLCLATKSEPSGKFRGNKRLGYFIVLARRGDLETYVLFEASTLLCMHK